MYTTCYNPGPWRPVSEYRPWKACLSIKNKEDVIDKAPAYFVAILVPARSQAANLNITPFGAVGDGITLNAAAIQRGHYGKKGGMQVIGLSGIMKGYVK